MSTHTYAILAISQAAFDEIKGSLAGAGYAHLFHKDADGRPVIEMQGLAIAAEYTTAKAAAKRAFETVKDEPLIIGRDPMFHRCDWYPIVPGTVSGWWGLVARRRFNDGRGKGKLYSKRRLIGTVDYEEGIFRFKEPRRAQVFVSFRAKFKP